MLENTYLTCENKTANTSYYRLISSNQEGAFVVKN